MTGRSGRRATEDAESLPWSAAADGCNIRIRAVPRASRDEVTGLVRDAGGVAWLEVRVAAPPENGRANDAVLRALARALGRPPRDLAIVSGGGGRWKRVRVQAPLDAVAPSLARLAAVTR